MDDCIFCKIAAGTVPADTLYEDGATLAFLDIRPNNHGHTLVIPKKHSRNLFDISGEDLAAMARTARVIAPAIIRATGAEGVNLAMNNERPAGQIVFHSHLHIIPRFADDGYRHWPGKSYADGESKRVAEKIRAALAERPYR